jgi:hypothetical protein
MVRKVKKLLKKKHKPAKKAVLKKRPAKKAQAKRTVKKSPKKKTAPKLPEFPWRVPLKGEKFLGVVEDFFGHVSVLATTLKQPLKVGDVIHVRGHTSDFTEPLASMQIEHVTVESAKAGDGVGIKVGQKSRKGDYIYRVL